jgi:flagellar motor switch protein FliG
MVSSKSQIALRKAAILVSSLDHRTADALLDRMSPDLAGRVRDAVLRLGDVSDEEMSAVVHEFLRAGGAAMPSDDAGVELDGTLARRISSGEGLPETQQADDSRDTHFQPLRLVASESLAQQLRHEHPQIVAVVVAHLPPARSAEVIKHLPERLQVDVLRRVAELDRADPQVLQDLEVELEQRLAGEIRAAKNRSAGLSAVTSILDAAGSDRDVIVRTVLRHDEQFSSLLGVESGSSSAIRTRPGRTQPELSRGDESAEDVESSEHEQAEDAVPPTGPEIQLPFEDLELLDDRGLAAVFATAEPEITLVALSGADESLLSRITAQLPSRQGRQLRRSIKRLGPLRLSDIEHAQREIALLASQMVAEGTIDEPAPRRWVAAA